MAGLLCRCGEGMYTSDDPCPYIVEIFYKSEADNALLYNPSITLDDFRSDWDVINDCARVYTDRPAPVEYWFCPVCERVYEVQAFAGGRWLRIFQKSEAPAPDSFDGWKEIYVMHDVDTSEALDENWDVLLSDYLKSHDSVVYYLSPDEKTAFGVERATSKIRVSYVLEDSWTPPEKQEEA